MQTSAGATVLQQLTGLDKSFVYCNPSERAEIDSTMPNPSDLSRTPILISPKNEARYASSLFDKVFIVKA